MSPVQKGDFHKIDFSGASGVRPRFARGGCPQHTPSSSAAEAPHSATGQWRASKLVDVYLYNEQNENIGEVDDVTTVHDADYIRLTM
jgi:hypothetical protein